MSSNEVAVLKVLSIHTNSEREMTIGEVAKHCRFSKSTVRRAMELFAKWGLLNSRWERYKSTGKRLFSITDEGRIYLSDEMELGL